MSTPLKNIEQILKKVHTLLDDNKFRILDKRQKNMATFAALGLTPSDVPDILRELTYKNYAKGPEDDRNTSDRQCIWVFGYHFEDDEIYIKLKITEDNLLNISFHIAEHPLKYPYTSC